jgi:hypothetical protein
MMDEQAPGRGQKMWVLPVRSGDFQVLIAFLAHVEKRIM